MGVSSGVDGINRAGNGPRGGPAFFSLALDARYRTLKS
jgi:hypothetical protein